MNMYEELKAWADKWGIKYYEQPVEDNGKTFQIMFDSPSYSEPVFWYNTETEKHTWYGGE